MHFIWILIMVCFTANSKVHSHMAFPHAAKDSFAFPDSFNQDSSLRQEQALTILETLGHNKTMFELLRTLTISDSFSGNDSKCMVSFTKLSDDFSKKIKYAVQVVDSWGKLESGVILGNIQWMGRYYECINTITPQFSGKYFYLSFKVPSRFPGAGLNASIGICLPSTCSRKEAEQIASPLSNWLKTSIHAYSPVQSIYYGATDILAIVITALLITLVVMGTTYELYIKSTESEGYHIVERGPRRLSVCANLILSFSIIKNHRALFDTTQKEGNINVLHGLRFYSMTWVILGHTFSNGRGSLDNEVDAARYYISHWSFETVGNAVFSVDTFFFLSGLLAVYVGLKEVQKRNGKINAPLMYAYRYLRLTPAYAYCILIHVSLYKKFGDGPLWPKTTEKYCKPCETVWWTNLVYINNMYPMNLNDGCFSWGWYLANEMQFFLLVPLLLYLMYRRPVIGVVVANIGALASMIVLGIVSTDYKHQPITLGTGVYFYNVVRRASYGVEDVPSGSDYSNETVTTLSSANGTDLSAAMRSTSLGRTRSQIFWSDTYTRPWCRISPYFVGILAGFIMYTYKTRVRMNKIVALIGWVIAFAVGLTLVYGLFGKIERGHYLTVPVAAFYDAVSRPVWAGCLAWIVIACAGGYGGPINAFLSWKSLVPLSRLTYCAYLVHPMIIYWFYGTLETKLHFSIPVVSIIYVGIVSVAYIVAYAVSILIEMPMMGITKTLFGMAQRPIEVPDVRHLYDQQPETPNVPQ